MRTKLNNLMFNPQYYNNKELVGELKYSTLERWLQCLEDRLNDNRQITETND